MRAVWLGRVEYIAAWQLQRELAALRGQGLADDALLLLEHPPTITLGRGAHPANLLKPREQLLVEGVAVIDVDRGGDVTYHGPGQLVGYPIFDLTAHRKDLHWFLREMEAALIEALSIYGIQARRFQPHTGVWVVDRKIAAIGIKVTRWVTTHGFGLNVTTLPEDFAGIVPCGISDFGVTSILDVTGRPETLEDIARTITAAFRDRFGSDEASRDLPIHLLGEESRKILSTALDTTPHGC